jgi:septal ring factor EnvC (AmiA/AmiB activator)
LAIAAALVGWAVVLLQDRWLDSLESELADARLQESTSSSQALADLKRLKSELEASKVERATLNQFIRQSETELKQLRAQLDQKAQAANESSLKFHTVTRTRLRAGPTTDAKEIAVIAEGASLQVIDTVEDGTWHEVRLLGYAFHELLKPSQGE